PGAPLTRTAGPVIGSESSVRHRHAYTPSPRVTRTGRVVPGPSAATSAYTPLVAGSTRSTSAAAVPALCTWNVCVPPRALQPGPHAPADTRISPAPIPPAPVPPDGAPEQPPSSSAPATAPATTAHRVRGEGTTISGSSPEQPQRNAASLGRWTATAQWRTAPEPDVHPRVTTGFPRQGAAVVHATAAPCPQWTSGHGQRRVVDDEGGLQRDVLGAG